MFTSDDVDIFHLSLFCHLSPVMIKAYFHCSRANNWVQPKIITQATSWLATADSVVAAAGSNSIYIYIYI